MTSKTLVSATLLVLAACAAACAGPVLDDILNYMFVDQTTPINPKYQWFNVENAMNLTKDAPIGQTFVTGPDTARIVRIRAKITPDGDWQKGEGAEMILWDSPAKKTALGRYTVWYEFRGYQFSQPEWEVKADVKPNTQYYFELSYVGEGDGKISKLGLMNGRDAYKAGQGHLGGKEADFDVCFQLHVKRPVDRVGNLKKAFARFNLDMPELAEVKAAVEREDFDTAQQKLVTYFENRQKPVPTLNPAKAFPGFDIKEADVALQNYFMSGEMGKGYAGPDINWRAEPDFNPDGTQAASGWNTGVNRFGPRGPLTKGYLATGDDKYVKKLNDVLIDWYLDNPPCGISHIGGDGSDPVWATLDAGIRLAANFICYSRIAKSPAFTLDGRMAYLLNMADEADTLVLNGAGDGGNWSFTQNAAMFEFALNFPEYTNAPKWRDAASERLAIAIKRDVLPDGVENESAPGYQRMSYGPLVTMYTLMRDRGAQTPFSADLKGVIEKQADYFLYLTMPNGTTPAYGDSSNQLERVAQKNDAELLGRPDMLWAATAGKEGQRPRELSKVFPYAGTVTMRSDWGGPGRPYEDARYLFMHAFRFGSHGHSDLNAITCYAYGRELLGDPGSYTYGSPEYNKITKSPAHNLMTIDGETHTRWPKSLWKCWSTSPVADYISSWLSAYKGGDYNREVFFIRANGAPGASEYWIVRDTAEGTGSHSLEQNWHFTAAPAQLDKKTLTARTVLDKGANLSIVQLDPSRLTCEQSVTKTWPWRGQEQVTEEMPTFVYKTQANLPSAIDTMLLPYKGRQPGNVQLEPLEKSLDGMNSAFKVVQGKVQDIFVFQRSVAKKWLASEKIGFTGERVFVRKVAGKVVSALLVNGTSLSVAGKQVIKSAAAVPWVSVSFGPGGDRAFAGSAEPGLSVYSLTGKSIAVTNTGSNDVIAAANPE